MRWAAISIAIAAFACSAPPVTAPSTLDASKPALPQCADHELIPAASDDWRADFASADIEQVRRIGGFYRAIQAQTAEQHRSASGPTFRVKCGDRLRAQILFNVPSERGSYDGAVVAFVDYRQITFSLNGEEGRVHRERMEPGEHHFTFISSPLEAGIHRLAVVFFDDDDRPGFAGAYEVLADIYTGAQPVAVALGEPQRHVSRSDPAIASARYGAYISVTPDRLQLAGNLTWSSSLQLWANIVGSVSSSEQVVVVTAIQDFEQTSWLGGMQLVRSAAGQLSALPLTPRRPARVSEQLRVLVFTEPLRQLAPQGVYDSDRDFRVVSSQKVFIRRA